MTRRQRQYKVDRTVSSLSRATIEEGHTHLFEDIMNHSHTHVWEEILNKPNIENIIHSIQHEFKVPDYATVIEWTFSQINVDTIDIFTESVLTVNTGMALGGALDMGTNLINNVVDPSNNQDAATKKYVDDSVAGVSQNLFETINPPSGTAPVADSTTDTLNLTSTDGGILASLVITGDSETDTVDFSVDVDDNLGNYDNSTSQFLTGVEGAPLTIDGTYDVKFNYDTDDFQLSGNNLQVKDGGIDHNSLANTHNLTTDIDHDQLTNFVANEHFLQSAITAISSGVGNGLVKTALGTLSVITDSSANWDLAYGWGDHSIVGYFDQSSDVDHNATTNTHNLTTDIDHDALTNFAANEHFLQTAITHLSTALNTGIVKVTTGSGALSVVTDNSSDWNTAYGWGDHSGEGYLNNIVEDGSPQLGADLDCQSLYDIVNTREITFAGVSGNNKVNFQNNHADALSFKDGATFYMTFKTTAAQESVHILQDLGLNGDIAMADGKSINLQEDINFTGATTENLILFPDNLASALIFKEGANTYMTFDSTNGSEEIRLAHNLNMGIFDITNVDTITATTLTDGTWSTTAGAFTGVASMVIANGGTIGQAAGPLMTFDDTNDFLEITGCNVGIGTPTPGGILHTLSAGHEDVWFETTGNKKDSRVNIKSTGDAYSNPWLKFYRGTQKSAIYVDNNDYLHIQNPTDAIVIDTSGNVGIGTTTPSEELDVNGTILATTFSDGTATMTGGNLNAISSIDGGGSAVQFDDDIAFGTPSTISNLAQIESSGANITFATDLQASSANIDMDSNDIQNIATMSFTSTPDYTTSNVLTDRVFNADTVVVAELADVVGTIIADLIAIGIFQ